MEAEMSLHSRIIEFFQQDWLIDHKAETVLMSLLKT